MGSFKFRIGQFFFVIGVILLAIFFVTGESNDPQYLYFFGGVLVVAFSIYLMLHNRPQISGESARFRSIRRQRQKSRERREKKRQELQERRER